MTAETDRALAQIYTERNRQEELWGEQNHPLLNQVILTSWQGSAQAYKEINANRVTNGTLSWDGILLGEVYEALAEENPMAMRAELVQAGAVIVSMIECIDRKWTDVGTTGSAIQVGNQRPSAAELLAGELEVNADG